MESTVFGSGEKLSNLDMVIKNPDLENQLPNNRDFSLKISAMERVVPARVLITFP